jgi:hypothetical protein
MEDWKTGKVRVVVGVAVVVVGAAAVVVVDVVAVVVEDVEDGTETVVVAAATVVAVGPASSRSMTKSRTPNTITATAKSSRLRINGPWSPSCSSPHPPGREPSRAPRGS